MKQKIKTIERGIEPGSKSYFDKPFENSIKFYRVGDVLDNSMCSTYIDISLANNVKFIARELVENIRESVKIDWTIRESVQAQMKVAIKRILRKYGYPPDKQQKATETVLEQAKLLCKDLTA